MIARTFFGYSRGCRPLTDDERTQRYACALGRGTGFDMEALVLSLQPHQPHAFARRGADGLALLARLRKLWAKVDRAKKKARRKTLKARAAPKKSNVVPIRRRA